MIPAGDWKWKSALAAFAVFAGLVLFWPLPDPNRPDPPEVPADEEAGISNAPPEEQPDEDELAPNPFPDRPPLNPRTTRGQLVYMVQEGDTAESIARLFVVRISDFRGENRLAYDDDVRPGDRVIIPRGEW